MSSCLAKKESSTTQARTITSSGVTFHRCKVCGGGGKDLLLPSGLCPHCTRLTTGCETRATAVEQAVHSHAVDVLMMQPQLRKYKKRPGMIPSHG